ncbi:glycine N-acyltransferase-like [Saccostrea echinata]|uniref:glycine N-acyltransferase-like n=1 Tax=Saccostrea echinata TaxID=191078 RepID=UPI002A80BB1E|nr:glycine N-acyltransferase-like [Saccostrea echinata]
MQVLHVDPTQYDKLEKDLETALPVSLCAYNHFKLLKRGLLTDKSVLVDSWPDFSAAVFVDSKKNKTVQLAIIFCKGPSFCQYLENLLRHASTAIASPLVIAGCTPDVKNALIDLFKSTESTPVQSGGGVDFVFTLPPDKILPLKIPDGFKLSHLRQDHVEYIRNSWRCKDKFELYGDLRQWIRHQIDNLPTVCIETEDGRPVAWEFQQEYGGVGMLHVESDYRRLKLGSVVTRKLAEKLLNDGQLVFCFVGVTNQASITFHENNGYVYLPFKHSFVYYKL